MSRAPAPLTARRCHTRSLTLIRPARRSLVAVVCTVLCMVSFVRRCVCCVVRSPSGAGSADAGHFGGSRSLISLRWCSGGCVLFVVGWGVREPPSYLHRCTSLTHCQSLMLSVWHWRYLICLNATLPGALLARGACQWISNKNCRKRGEKRGRFDEIYERLRRGFYDATRGTTPLSLRATARAAFGAQRMCAACPASASCSHRASHLARLLQLTYRVHEGVTRAPSLRRAPPTAGQNASSATEPPPSRCHR